MANFIGAVFVVWRGSVSMVLRKYLHMWRTGTLMTSRQSVGEEKGCVALEYLEGWVLPISTAHLWMVILKNGQKHEMRNETTTYPKRGLQRLFPLQSWTAFFPLLEEEHDEEGYVMGRAQGISKSTLVTTVSGRDLGQLLGWAPYL
ncbi:hypothetical protein EDC04DRAFT_2607501 [Pisolithus marmoratus]|nr:hypothetical protein EDC04DRAFT_2607501 [Pisolithus marmoratus]